MSPRAASRRSRSPPTVGARCRAPPSGRRRRRAEQHRAGWRCAAMSVAAVVRSRPASGSSATRPAESMMSTRAVVHSCANPRRVAQVLGAVGGAAGQRGCRCRTRPRAETRAPRNCRAGCAQCSRDPPVTRPRSHSNRTFPRARSDGCQHAEIADDHAGERGPARASRAAAARDLVAGHRRQPGRVLPQPGLVETGAGEHGQRRGQPGLGGQRRRQGAERVVAGRLHLGGGRRRQADPAELVPGLQQRGRRRRRVGVERDRDGRALRPEFQRRSGRCRCSPCPPGCSRPAGTRSSRRRPDSRAGAPGSAGSSRGTAAPGQAGPGTARRRPGDGRAGRRRRWPAGSPGDARTGHRPRASRPAPTRRRPARWPA